MPKELIWSARKNDFKVETFCSGGPGGQHQNKTETGVRITHRESGLSAESRTYRSQHQNLKSAFRKLARLLVERYAKKSNETEISSEVIRTYNEPDNRVKDHASGLRMSYDEIVSKGNLEPMIEARRKNIDERL